MKERAINYLIEKVMPQEKVILVKNGKAIFTGPKGNIKASMIGNSYVIKSRQDYNTGLLILEIGD